MRQNLPRHNLLLINLFELRSILQIPEFTLITRIDIFLPPPLLQPLPYPFITPPINHKNLSPHPPPPIPLPLLIPLFPLQINSFPLPPSRVLICPFCIFERIIPTFPSFIQVIFPMAIKPLSSKGLNCPELRFSDAKFFQ